MLVMARRVQIRMTDDLDGAEATQTVRFALDGRELEIDLSDQNAARLRKAFLPYISAGRRLGARTGTSRYTRLPSDSPGKTTAELARVRAWARENGYAVSDRGRVKGDVLDAYHAARG
jgi:hypothetical protein